MKKTNTEHWPISSPTGNLVTFKNREIEPILKEIGLGASLFLLTLKAFAWLFFVLTILSLPIMLIYLSGSESETFNPLLSLGIGNLGESGPICTTINLAKNDGKVTLNCPSGNLVRLEGIGLPLKKD